MDSTYFIQKIRELLPGQVDPVLCARVSGQLNRLEKGIGSDRIRIGVVGPGRSGKSTLINAVSGNNVLPSAIVPVKGCLVSCTYGSEYSATVSFQDPSKEDVILKGDGLSLQGLIEYSDDRLNRGNSKGVRSISINSPNFDLGSDLVMLEGFGMKEGSSLKALLAAIDICIFVTDVRSPDQAETRELLKVVGEYDFPLIVIGNKLDTLEGSESEAGSESPDMLGRVINEVDIKHRDQIQVVRMSAEKALKWKLNEYDLEKNDVSQEEYDRSNYPEFIIKIKYLIKRKKKELELNRIRTVRDILVYIKTKWTGEESSKQEESDLLIKELDEYQRSICPEDALDASSGTFLKDLENHSYADVDEHVLFMLNLTRKLCLRQHRQILKSLILKIGAEDCIPLITGTSPEKLNRFIYLSGITDLKAFSLNRHADAIKDMPGRKCFFILINGKGTDDALNDAIKWHMERMTGSGDLVFWVVQDLDEMLLLEGARLKERLYCLKELSKMGQEGLTSLVWLMHDNPVYNLGFLEYQMSRVATIKDESDLLSGLFDRFGGLCDGTVLSNIGRMIRRNTYDI